MKDDVLSMKRTFVCLNSGVPPENRVDLFESVIESTKEVLRKKGAIYDLAFLEVRKKLVADTLDSDDLAVVMFSTNYSDHEEKAKQINALTSLVQELQPRRVVFAFDAWMLVTPIGELPDVRPREHPNRQETLNFVESRPEGNTRCVVIPYTRTGKGKIRFGEQEEGEGIWDDWTEAIWRPALH